jgi:hypothetical protein
VPCIALIAFLSTDRYFTFLDDETKIIAAARKPMAQTVSLFLNGQGQHEHPPLSDLLLHFWLPVGDFAPWALRLPSILFYLAGLLVLAAVAKSMAGDSAFKSVLCIGAVWPFAFHFARLTGWYSFCFMMVALATIAHLAYLKKPGWRRLAWLITVDVLLVYSNYYGWAIVGCLAFEVCVARGRREAIRFVPIVLGIVLAADIPLWHASMAEILPLAAPVTGGLFFSRFLNAVFNFYSLFVSESVAPWIWYLSVPAAIAICTGLGAALVLLPAQGRRFLFYFTVLFGGLAIPGLIGTKRLLFISDWLILCIAVAYASPGHASARRVLLISLTLVAVIGWIGVGARRYYSAPHFVEPWPVIADQAARQIKDGGVVVSNSRSFLFYLGYSLRHAGLATRQDLPRLTDHTDLMTLRRTAGSRVVVNHWAKAGLPGMVRVFFIKGVNSDLVEQTAQAEAWLDASCRLTAESHIVPDSGYELKARFFGGSGQQPWRIWQREFDCAAPMGASR